MTGIDVTYTYGTSGIEADRPTCIVDGCGSYECKYDALEMSLTRRAPLPCRSMVRCTNSACFTSKSYQKMKKELLILSFSILSLFLTACINGNDNRRDADSTSITNEIVCISEVDSTQSCLDYVEKTKVFLNIDYFGEIMIYDHPQGNVIRKVKNDSIREEFVIFGLLDKNDSMFYIVAYSSLTEEEITKGWIQKKSHLGIFLPVYQGNMALYKSPDRSSEVLAAVEEYRSGSYEVTDFCDNWLKIQVKEKGKSIEGWIPPEEQCCNVYSTCN